MVERSILIRSCGDYYADVRETPPELGPLVKEALGAPVRRVGRFVQLALIGAARCMAGGAAPTGTGVYLTSGRGDMEMTIDVMTQLYRDRITPRPLSFINTVSNAAGFYIAKQFQLHGRSAFVCNTHFSFEAALQLVMLDMETGMSAAALVGSVDIALAPLDVHRRRLRIAPETPVAEGSHWLLLEAVEAGALGPRLMSVEMLPDADALLLWMKAQVDDPASTVLACGQFADEEEIAEIAALAGVTRVFDYRSGRDFYDSQSGAAISAFLAGRPDGVRTLLHVNQDAEGRFAAFAVQG